MSDNNQRIQKQVLGDIYLSSLIITDINLDDIGGGSGGNVNIKIDNELSLSSNNPVKNSVITENFNNLSSLKLDKSEYETNNTNVSENIINLTENKVDLSIFNENITNLTENKVELSVFNETITTIKGNKVDLSVFNENNNTINENITNLNTNKLDLSAYVVDEELNESSPNPV